MPSEIIGPAVLVRNRLRLILITCAIAASASFLAGLLLPKKFTAVCRIVIDPPAGTDQRVATAVSPVYLESLRTYELFASSDDLFSQAAARFGLRGPGTAIERLKRQVLKVEIPRSTKILEIYATLGDARKAHDLALYIAENTVALSRSAGKEGDRELTAEAEDRQAAARARYGRADRAWSAVATRSPLQKLSGELDADIELRSRIQRQLAAAEVSLAEAEAARDTDVPQLRAAVAGRRRQVAELDERIGSTQRSLAERATELDQLGAERKSAEANLQAAERHLEDVRAGLAYRGERLNLIDRGIVPDRPSFPNVPLIVGVAVFAGLVLSSSYALLEASYRQSDLARPRRALKIANAND